MGIAGLTTFINMNPSLLEAYKLHGTRVVIDGNNLLHILYYEYHTNYKYCGNYDQFAKNIENYFNAFFICDVKPVIVFDGGYEIDDRKLKTTLRRAQDRIYLGGFISHGGGGKILPVLAEVTFKKTLERLGIPHVTCDFEADDQLAALANAWECPVISNDSDFFIFNLRGGFIPLDHLMAEVTKDSDGTRYLGTRIYRIHTFVKHFKCPDVNFVPLFATMLGNDFVDGRKFENFFSNIKLPKVKSKRFTIPKKNTKMAGLLLWLENMDSLDESIGQILQYFKKDDREQFEKIIIKSIKSYTKIESRLQYFFENAAAEFSERGSAVKSYNGVELPEWLLKEFRRGNLSVKLFNVLVLHRVIPLCQVENMQSESAYQCAYGIRRVIYSILLLHERHTFSAESSSDKDDEKEKLPRLSHVEEYTRVGRKLGKQIIEPSFFLPNDKPLPVLQKIPELSKEERISVLFDALGLNACDFETLPSDIQLVMASTIYWLCHANPKVTKEHLQSLLVSVIKLYCIDPVFEQLRPSGNVGSGYELKNDLCSKILDNCTFEEIQAAKQRIDKISHLPQHDNTCADVVHGFAQWHACLLAAIHLNQLLLGPFPEPDPARIYNGTIAYTFCKELMLRKDPELYVSEVLGRRNVISEVHSNLMHLCMNLTEGLVFHSPVHTRKKGSKRSGLKKASKGKEIHVSKTSQDADSDENEVKSQRKHVRTLVHKSCDINNMFSMLAISDESASELEGAGYL